MNKKTYDLIVLGSGPAASTVAEKVNAAGRRVAIVEKREFGGTCALRGCNPKKVYTNAGALLEQVRGAENRLIRTDHARIEWSDLLKFKREFTEPVLEKSERSFREDGIDTYQGAPRFTGAAEIVVDNQTLAAEKFLIAVGASPTPLDFPGAEFLTRSDDFLELRHLPPRVVFVGGGYISMEFGHVTARYGAETTIIERGPRVLESFDPDLVEQLTDWSRKQGMRFELNAEVAKIEQRADQYALTFARGDEQTTIVCDLAVHGAGRTPSLDGLDLENANVQASDQGIEVDEFLRSTTNPNIYAAGDCAATGALRLTPVANEDARAVAKNILADTPELRPSHDAVPQVVFTSPTLAAVGMSAEEAEASGRNIATRRADISDWNSVRKSGHGCAGYKMLIDEETDLLLGAHLLGPSAEESINLLALAIKNRLTTKDIKSTLFAFPTYTSDLRKMM